MMHIESMKEATKDKPIAFLKDPEKLVIPLFENFGNKPEPMVNVGDHVRKYQIIGKTIEGFSAPVHTPVSGIVEEIKMMTHADGTKATTIIIRNDFKYTQADIPEKVNLESPSEILKAIENAGIVGLGGAQFPTAMKYDRKEKEVNTFIINGAECEPFLTGDYALMKNHCPEILEGIMLIDKTLDAKEIVIAFERNNKELNEVFNKHLTNNRFKKIRTQIVPDEYPQGGELQLIKTVTGIEIKKDSVPLEKGIIVSNVGTVYAVYNALVNGEPLTERVLTVSGKGVKHAGNYRVKIGTPISHIIECCEIDTENHHIILGGPMMSPHIRNFSIPLNKGSLGIIAVKKEKVHRQACIWCGYCVDVCPMRLMPMKYDQFFRQGKYRKLEVYNIDDCIECSSCEYICPSNVPLIESIKEGKAKLKQIKDASGKKTI